MRLGGQHKQDAMEQPIIVKEEDINCFYCEMDLLPTRDIEEYFVPNYTYHRRGLLYLRISPVCRVCFLIEEATAEAKEMSWRFAPVLVNEEDRCPCGAASYCPSDGPKSPIWGLCIRCWREKRMLDKWLSDAKFNRRLIAQIKESVKNVAKARDQDDGRVA